MEKVEGNMRSERRARVGILTFHFAKNYGAVLQAYALQSYLVGRGFDVEFVDFSPTRLPLFKLLAKPLALVNKLCIACGDFYRSRKTGRQMFSASQFSAEFFDDFRSSWLSLSTQVYNHSNLKNIDQKYDVLIVGSDQVWAVDPLLYGDAYLLGFASENISKVAYAASFGRQSINKYEQKIFSRALKEFDFVGVRESSGEELLVGLGIEAKKVCDPTILNTSFQSLISVSSLHLSSSYLLVYQLGQSADLSWEFWKLVADISSKLSIPVVVIGSVPTLGLEIPILREFKEGVPVEDFVSLFQESEYVITNSFHGVVFASKFQKDFLAFTRDGRIGGQDIRILDYLSQVGLGERFCRTVECAIDQVNVKIDFTSVEESLKNLRSDSKAALDSSLVLSE